MFCNVFMSHASQEPDFHGSLLLSSVDSRIVWNPPRKLCLNWDINNLQSKTSTIMWVCYFIKPVYLFMSRDKESNLKVLVKGNMYQPMLWALSPVYTTKLPCLSWFCIHQWRGLDRRLPERKCMNVASCSHVTGKPQKLTFQVCAQMSELYLN